MAIDIDAFSLNNFRQHLGTGIVLALVANGGCFAGAEAAEFRGPILPDALGVVSEMTDGSVLTIKSPGGIPSAGLQMAQEIERKLIAVKILDYCISACAEYVLPAASGSGGIEFYDHPIVAFHWNPQMIEAFALATTDRSIRHCDNPDALALRELQSRTANADFWVKVETKLGENRSELRLDTEGCPEVRMRYEIDFWLPTSDTLRDDYGLYFEGSVCADDISKCQARLRYVFAGKKIRVGNAVMDFAHQ